MHLLLTPALAPRREHMTDPLAMLADEILGLLRGEGDPEARYTLAKATAGLMGAIQAQAALDLSTELGSLTAAARQLGVSPQAISKSLAKYNLPSPNGPGRPKTPKE
jgi:hypothetical protein